MGGDDEGRSALRFPSKRCSAAALLTDVDSRILLVKPSYRSGWLLPGGVVESDESPTEALRREVREELSIDLDIRGLYCVDYIPRGDGLDESLHFLFECVMSDAAIPPSVDGREIIDARWAAYEEALGMLVPSIARRLRSPPGHYLEAGAAITPFAPPYGSSTLAVGAATGRGNPR